MGSLLLDEQPLMVLPKLAKKIGLNESIILQQMHYWLKMKLNAKEGYYWVYNSYPEWVEQFPFWSEATVKRTINKLEDMELLISGNYNKLKIDKTKWYRINYEELDKYKEDDDFNGKEPSKIASGQNDPTIVPMSTEQECNVTLPLPETNSKTTTKIKKTSNHNFTVDDIDNSKLLLNLILENNENFKKPDKIESWANDFRLMRERDNRTNEQIKYLIEWSQKHSFWHMQILSTKALRRNFDKMVAQLKYEKNKVNNQYNNQAELKPWEVAAYGEEPGRANYDDDRSIVQQQIKIEQPKFNI